MKVGVANGGQVDKGHTPEDQVRQQSPTDSSAIRVVERLQGLSPASILSVKEAENLVPEYLELLRKLVEIESPSHDEAGNLAVAEVIAKYAEQFGGQSSTIPVPGLGAHLLLRFPGTESEAEFLPSKDPANRELSIPAGSTKPPLLVLAHMDTVHPKGTLERLPFAVTEDRVQGPGVYDMKSGVALVLLALRILTSKAIKFATELRFFVSCDEEVGSNSSRELIEQEAQAARATLVLEPSAPGGHAKTRRKGVGAYQLSVTGVPAHAGIEPEAGANAVHEIARQITAITELADAQTGTTVNVGVVEGGTGSNVLAETAHCTIDTRFWQNHDGDRLDAKLRALVPFDKRCKLMLDGGINRGAMEKTATSNQLFEHARTVAAGLGFEVDEAKTGGASDGNFTAAAGCPTLDGLGIDGGGAHTLTEHILIDDIPRRIAFITALLATT